VRFDVSSTTAYSYFRLAVTETAETDTTYDEVFINELQLFEAATGVGAAPTSAKLQVAGSLGLAKGSEFFAGDDVVMELPKHDRPLTKYPEVDLTGSSIGSTTYTTAGYTISSSSTYNFANHNLSYAFDDNSGTAWSSDLGYSSSTGLPASGDGDYIQIYLPIGIKLNYTTILSQNNSSYYNSPRDVIIYGSNDGSNWTTLNTSTDLPLNGASLTATVHITSSTYYRYFRLRLTKIYIASGNASYGRVADWKLYGTEEGDTSVDVVHRSIPNTPGQPAPRGVLGRQRQQFVQLRRLFERL
jgi:hypothetical protein